MTINSSENYQKSAISHPNPSNVAENKMGHTNLRLEDTLKYIRNIDFSNIINKMVSHQGWKRLHAEQTCEMYRNFLYINRKFSKKAPFPPSEEIDEFWHNHILDTQKYHTDCQNIFGQYFHHYPYFGIDGKTSSIDLVKAFEQLQACYRQEFNGKEIIRIRFLSSKIISFVRHTFMHFPKTK